MRAGWGGPSSNPWPAIQTAGVSLVAALLLGAAPLRAAEPVLRLESHAPLSLVTSTAFGPDGRLYVAGFDKVVRSWKPDDRGGLQSANPSYRVPIGPGIAGALNDVALSDDGRWLATGGNGWFHRMADFRKDGTLLSRNVLDVESRREVGTVYLFDREANAYTPLVHHSGPVIALSFDGRTLASLAWEFTDKMEVGEYSVAVWDAPTKRLLASTKLGGVDGPAKIRPGFLLRRLGDAEKNVAVLSSFGREIAYVWRPAQPVAWSTVKVGSRATCIVRGPDHTALAGCFADRGNNNWKAAFVPIDLDTLAPAAPRFIPTERLPNGAIVGAAASHGNAPVTAYVYRPLVGNDGDWLCAMDSAHNLIFHQSLNDPNSLADQQTKAPPRVSIAHDGSRVVVAMPDRSEFREYALDGRAQDPRILSGSWSAFASGRLVEKDGEIGFELSGLSHLNSNGGGVLWPATMQVSKTTFGVRGAVHERGKTISLLQESLTQLACTTPVGAIAIRTEGQTITAFVGMQPHADGPPLAAVAMVDALGQPELRIYRADTGEQLRRCTAHVGRITSLSVSADGGLLLSSSLDRTFGLWNVADLGETIENVGAVKGVTLDDARRVVSGNVAGLQVGDVLVGRTADGKFLPFANQFEFLGAAKATHPGRSLAVVVERNGQRFDVALPISQGMDERKPLAQLYVRDDGKWIAWSPFGPYDSNHDAAEEWIGWHFNPEGAAPVRFALGGQYRQQYRRPGLLRRLLQTRNLTAALDAWRRLDAEPPDPNISLAMTPLDRARTEWATPSKNVELSLRITNPDFPLERLAALRATVDGEPVALEQVRPTEFKGSADLKKPGRHTIRMTADTTSPLARHFDDERTVLFAPPKPRLTPTREWVERTKAASPAPGVWTVPEQTANEFALQTRRVVDAAFGPMNFKVALNGEPQSAAGGDDLRLPLRVGENRVVVTLSPKTPAEGVEDSVQMAVVVRRTEPPKTFAPPTITDLRVEVGPQRKSQAVDVTGTLTVNSTNVRIAGRAVSQENIARLEINGRPAPGFAPAPSAPFAIETTLKPGENHFRLFAKGASGPETRHELVLDCRPPLPKVAATFDEHKRDWQWSGAALTAGVTVGFDAVGERLPFKATLRRNGAVVASADRTADQAYSWRVAVPLVPGENRLTVDVEAAWAKSASALVTVWVRRPPKLIGVSSTVVGTKPFVDLTAEVDALDGFPPTELAIDGRLHQKVERIQNGPPDATGVVRWKLLARDVVLRQGPNNFSVVVRNGEGDSAPIPVGGLVYAPPPPPKATVTWLSPTADGNQERPDVDVQVHIESTTPLQSATLSVSGDGKPIADLKPTTAEKDRFVYEIKQRLSLAPGRRSLAVHVLNGGGETQAERVVNYIQRPAELKLLALDSSGARIEARRAADGSAAFPKVAADKQTLIGEVVFADANDPARSAPATLRVIVNGLQQPTVDIDPAEGNVRRFRAPVALADSGPNHIFAEVVGLPISDDCNVEGIVLGCNAPARPKRLHLVLIGVGEEDEAKLRAEALEAFKETTAFERSPGHQAVCGYVTGATIREAVDRLRMELVESGGRREAGDVVVFYFRGQESIENRRLKLLTSEPAWLPRSKFDAGDLATRFADVPGAQVLMFDVSRSESGGEAEPPFRRKNAGLFGFRRPPKEAPVLFSFVKDAIPNIGRLGELEKALAKTTLPAGIKFDPFVPSQLAELVLNGR